MNEETLKSHGNIRSPDQNKKSLQIMNHMESKNNNEIGRNSSRLADEIFAKLNQGSLFEIHQILDNLEDDQQKKARKYSKSSI